MIEGIPEKHQIHHHTLSSDRLESLVDGPKTRDEVDFKEFRPSPDSPMRDMIRSLKRPGGSNSSVVTGKWHVIYYLYGDERRAIRKAIHLNEDFIREALTTESNSVFAHSWPKGMYLILMEEWQYYQRNK